MSDYIPTNRVRFVERFVPSPQYGPNIGTIVLILQQWWCLPDDDSPTGHINEQVGEWRDVPVEPEQ